MRFGGLPCRHFVDNFVDNFFEKYLTYKNKVVFLQRNQMQQHKKKQL